MPLLPSRFTLAISFPALDRLVDFLERNETGQLEIDELTDKLKLLNEKLSKAIDQTK